MNLSDLVGNQSETQTDHPCRSVHEVAIVVTLGTIACWAMLKADYLPENVQVEDVFYEIVGQVEQVINDYLAQHPIAGDDTC